MKKLIAILLPLLPLSMLAAPPIVPLTFSWRDTNNIPILSQYSPTTNDCYVLIGTNDIAAPMATWPTVAMFTNWTLGTNAGNIWFTNSASVPQGTWFFALVTSNFWGVAGPSSVAQTGPASTPSVNFNLSR